MIAITGANGFVGRHLRRFAKTQKIPVVALARRSFSTYSNETQIITNDYSEPEILDHLSECDSLVHLVGIGKQTVNYDYIPVNVDLTRRIVQICKRCKIRKIVYVSGLGVSRSTTLGYFISKYKAEQEIIRSGIDYTIFRPSFIIDKDDPLTKNLKKQSKKGSIIIPGSGRFTLQPIFVGDVVKLIVQSISDKKLSKMIIDLVGPHQITFDKFVKAFVGRSKVKVRRIPLEKAYYEAIHNPQFPYGIDDLNILVGDFKGDFSRLRKLTDLDFVNYQKVLDANCLS